MRIGGLNRASFIDYPGKISAIVFTIGCNFRCPFCHNPELVDETADEMSEVEIIDFLTRRKNLLDAVTITGGEPTLHDDLPDFLRKVKALGYLVKLDSNGTNPGMLRQIMSEQLVDYLAMDIKSPIERYSGTVGRPVNTDAIKESIELLKTSGIQYEFRTTIVETLFSKDDLDAIGNLIRGADAYYLQKFIPTKTLSPAFMEKMTYSDEEFERMRSTMEQYVQKCEIR